MQRTAIGVRLLVVAMVAVAALISAPAAEAAPKAAIVVDLRNGKVLYARSADARRHPASLTKMMTLYLTFEAVRDGSLKLDQKLRVSRRAARQPASKLYLRAGQRVSVRSLIRATAIKSANDAAMVLAEAIGGSQAGFAKMMTDRAQSLGMVNTRFRNPHGLTQKGHYSTARDMAILARHLFFDFRKYYNIFGRRSDYAAGKRIWNTNRLLATYRGADGLKTGYTRAAGYNLAATAHRGQKRIIAVQMGANSSADRARRVTRLLDIGFARAKPRVRMVAPTGAGRDRILVGQSPLPPRRPGTPQTGLAALSAAIAPAQAAASEVPTQDVVGKPSPAQRTTAPSRFAPVNAEMPVPRGGVRQKARRGTVPLPKPRPVRVARQGQLSWAAEIGPFTSGSEALAHLSELPGAGTAAATLSKSPAAGFNIVLPRANRRQADAVCETRAEVPPACRVVRRAGR